jgi:hypothetical protein
VRFSGGRPGAGVEAAEPLRGPGAGAVERPALGVMAAEALRAAPDGVLATEVTPPRHAQPGAAPPPRLLGQLQGDPLYDRS